MFTDAEEQRLLMLLVCCYLEALALRSGAARGAARGARYHCEPWKIHHFGLWNPTFQG